MVFAATMFSVNKSCTAWGVSVSHSSDLSCYLRPSCDTPCFLYEERQTCLLFTKQFNMSWESLKTWVMCSLKDLSGLEKNFWFHYFSWCLFPCIKIRMNIKKWRWRLPQLSLLEGHLCHVIITKEIPFRQNWSEGGSHRWYSLTATSVS